MSDLPPIPTADQPPGSAAPMRVEPLNYSTPVAGRPGILTAVGVVSIVLGSLGLLSNAGGVLSSAMFMSMPRITTVAPTPVAPAAPATAAPLAHPRGLDATQRLPIVDGLNRVHLLSSERKLMLDRLLANHGQDMFLLWGNDLNAGNVARNVTQSGRLSNGNDYFVVGMGRIELADDHAVFSPNDTGEIVRVDETDSIDPSNSAGAAAGPTPSAPAPAPVTINFAPNRVALLANGGEACLSSLLAGFLLICGILVLRDSARARKLHLIYAGIKFPLAIVGAVTYGMMMSSLMTGFTPTGSRPAPPMTPILIGVAAVQGLITLIYPVSLLIVLNLASIKRYYGVVSRSASDVNHNASASG